MIRKCSMPLLLAFGLAASATSESTGPAGRPASPEMIEKIALSEHTYGDKAGLIFKLKATTRVKEKVTDSVQLEIQQSDRNFLATYLAPKKYQGQKLLRKGRNFWFADPNKQKAYSISPRQRKHGGGAYGEIASTDFRGEYQIAQLPDESVNGVECFVFDLKAKFEENTYKDVKYWMDKKRTVPVQAVFHAAKDGHDEAVSYIVTYEMGNQVIRDGKEEPFVTRLVLEKKNADTIIVLEYTDVLRKDFAPETFDPNRLEER